MQYLFVVCLIRESCKDNCNGLQVPSDNQTDLVSKKGKLCVCPFTSPCGKVLEVQSFFFLQFSEFSGYKLELTNTSTTRPETRTVKCFENLQTGRQRCLSLTSRHGKKYSVRNYESMRRSYRPTVSIIISPSTSR
jgi:hypothetical protein